MMNDEADFSLENWAWAAESESGLGFELCVAVEAVV